MPKFKLVLLPVLRMSRIMTLADTPKFAGRSATSRRIKPRQLKQSRYGILLLRRKKKRLAFWDKSSANRWTITPVKIQSVGMHRLEREIVFIQVSSVMLAELRAKKRVR